MPPPVRLRPVEPGDIPLFFAFMQDPDARWQAAFMNEHSSDAGAFRSHWERLLGDENVLARTVLVDGEVAGHVAGFRRQGEPEVGCWIDRAHSGRGVATEALRRFLEIHRVRPIHAGAAWDNAASRRVLEKLGFEPAGVSTEFASARGREIELALYVLRA
jgi:RimJ/RimL family protein N-acetyltransferase